MNHPRFTNCLEVEEVPTSMIPAKYLFDMLILVLNTPCFILTSYSVQLLIYSCGEMRSTHLP
jgi:hypothetical protein